MKAVTNGILAVAIFLAGIEIGVLFQQHRNSAAIPHVSQEDPFQMMPLPNAENAQYAAMTAEEAARAFFEACGRGDWDEIEKFCAGVAPFDASFKEQMTGVAVVSIGKSFTRPGFAATFVPYEIRFKNGHSKNFNLALRQDNPQKRWMFDGGL